MKIDKSYYKVSIGDRFDKLLVLERCGNFTDKNGRIIASKFKCICDCGDINYYKGSLLSRGISHQCKHCSNKNKIKGVFKIGDIINDLIVISDDFIIREWNDGTKRRYYLCKCKCGNESYYSTTRLNNKRSKECKSCAYKKRPQSKLRLSGYERLFNITIKDRCKNNSKLSYSINLDKFINIVSKKCIYCGAEPTYRKYLYDKIFANGVDRIDSDIGYHIDNCVPCCKKCNMAKSDMTQDEFKNHIIQIYNYLNK